MFLTDSYESLTSLPVTLDRLSSLWPASRCAVSIVVCAFSTDWVRSNVAKRVIESAFMERKVSNHFSLVLTVPDQ